MKMAQKGEKEEETLTQAQRQVRPEGNPPGQGGAMRPERPDA